MIKECLEVSAERTVTNAIPLVTDAYLAQALSLLQSERVSGGGNIRDKTMSDLTALLTGGGQIWGWVEKHTVLSVCTIEPKIGASHWWYLNNGVTRKDVRGQGLSGLLIRSLVATEGQEKNMIVLYVRQGLFERLGFTEVTIDELVAMDEPIAALIQGKLRQGQDTHIFIKRTSKNNTRYINKSLI